MNKTEASILPPGTDFNIVEMAQAVAGIVREIGAVLCEASDVAVYTKEGHTNFATEMDIKVQRMLCGRLQNLIPGAVFILEEEQESIPALGEYTWIIDPIDGTQNFINDYHVSCISVALLRGDAGILGMVYNPYADELFCGMAGKGAFLNGKPISPSDKPFEAAVICFGTALYYRELAEPTMAVAGKLFGECCDLRRSGSAALDICYVACGRCDAMFELRLCPWDYAGGAIILREAGGRIAPIGPGTLNYTEKTGVVAAGAGIFARMKREIDEIVFPS